MPRASSITKLPPKVRDSFLSLVREGHSVDAIVEHLASLGHPRSRSAVGRAAKSAREMMGDYLKAQEVAGAWETELEKNPKSNVGRLLAQMLRSVAFRTISAMGEGEDQVDPKHFNLLTKSLKDLASADKLSAEFEARVRKVVAEEAAAAASQVAKTGGLSEEKQAELRRAILGVVKAP